MNNDLTMFNGFLVSQLTPERRAQAQHSHESLAALIERKQRTTVPGSVVDEVGIPHMYAKLRKLGEFIDACDAYENACQKREEAAH